MSTAYAAGLYTLPMDASEAYLRGYLSVREDARKTTLSTGKKIPGKRCGGSYIAAPYKCSKNSGAQEKAARQELAGKVRKAKGLKPKGPKLSPSKDPNQWWAGIGMKGRMEVSSEAEGWWNELSPNDRRQALRTAGVTARKVGIKGINQTRPENADSILMLGGVNSQRVYVEYAKRRESGKITSIKRAKLSLSNKLPESSRGSRKNKATGKVESRAFAEKKLSEGISISKGQVSPGEYIKNRGWTSASVSDFQNSPDTQNPNDLVRFPRRAEGEGTIRWSDAESREWGEYLMLRRGEVEDWANRKGLSDWMPEGEIKKRITQSRRNK